MCYINSSDLGNNGNIEEEANLLLQPVEILLQENIIVPGNGIVGIFEFEVHQEDINDSEEDNEGDDDFTAYEWMAKTDLEEFDKETEQQYWHEVIAEAEESQRTWDQACASCPESDLPGLIPEYMEATTLNANLIRVAQEESAGSQANLSTTESRRFTKQ